MSTTIKTDISITPKVPFYPLSIDPHPSWAATVLIWVIKTLPFLEFLCRTENGLNLCMCLISSCLWFLRLIHAVSSVTQSCPNVCNPMDCSTPDFPAYHQLPELTQTPVHRVCDAIQPSHPLSSPSPPAFNLSQHQGLF